MMAEAERSIFNKKATEKLRSPDDLDKYVRVTNPSVWVLLAACAALLAALLAWGIFGTVATSVSSTGVCGFGNTMCLLSAEDTARVHVGDAANVGGESMKVSSISATPASREEIKKRLKSDYLAASLMKEDWAYIVTFEGDSSELPTGVPLSVNITVERIAPIELIIDWR